MLQCPSGHAVARACCQKLLMQASVQASPSPAYLSSQLKSAQLPPSPILQHQPNPAAKEQHQQASPVASPHSQQLPASPHLSQVPHKQTLQEAHAEAQQHFQHAHPVATESALLPPISPAASGIYAMVGTTMLTWVFCFDSKCCCFTVDAQMLKQTFVLCTDCAGHRWQSEDTE